MARAAVVGLFLLLGCGRTTPWARQDRGDAAGGPDGGDDPGRPDAGRDAGPDAGPPPGCFDDAHEEDDLPDARQKPLYHTPARGPLVVEGVACPGDLDHWLAYADQGLTSGVTARWDAALGDLEVRLLDALGQPLALGQPGDTDVRQPGLIRLWRHQRGGYFHVQVRSLGGDVRYRLEVLAPVVLH